MLLILDNRDSFVFNLDQAFRARGVKTRVVRSDRITAAELLEESYSALVLSPGPGHPAEAGCLLDAVRRAAHSMPILGVCLGCQALAEADGATLVPVAEIFHGRCSRIRHDGHGLFAGIEQDFDACRYHSLAIDPATLAQSWECTAWTGGNVLMAIRHRARPWFGLQFHPESFRTPVGPKLIENFLSHVQARETAVSR